MALIDEHVRPLRRAEYDRMVRMGLFEGERVELLRGRVVRMAPQYAPHAGAIELLTEILVLQVQGRARVRPQLPFIAVAELEPEPDIAVVALADHTREHPSEAYLLIEVSASSLAIDRAVKAPLYGHADDREVGCRSQPTGGTAWRHRRCTSGQAARRRCDA